MDNYRELKIRCDPDFGHLLWEVGVSTLNIVLRFLILTIVILYDLSGAVVIHIHHFKHHADKMKTLCPANNLRTMDFVLSSHLSPKIIPET